MQIPEAPRNVLSALSIPSVPCVPSVPSPGFPGDPFMLYGKRVSELLMSTIKRVDPELREATLEGILDELEPGLSSRVVSRARKYKGKGLRAKPALKAAIASSVSEGLAREIVKIGKTGKLPGRRSLVGLSVYAGAHEQALSGLVSSITGAASKVRRVTSSRLHGGAATATRVGSAALSKIKGLTCTVMRSPLSNLGAGAAGAALGAPPQTAVVGKQLAQGVLCPPGTVPISQDALTTPIGGGMPGWVLPVGIGAAGLVAVLLLRKPS